MQRHSERYSAVPCGRLAGQVNSSSLSSKYRQHDTPAYQSTKIVHFSHRACRRSNAWASFHLLNIHCLHFRVDPYPLPCWKMPLPPLTMSLDLCLMASVAGSRRSSIGGEGVFIIGVPLLLEGVVYQIGKIISNPEGHRPYLHRHSSLLTLH